MKISRPLLLHAFMLSMFAFIFRADAAVPESSVNLKLDYEYSKDGRVTARTFNNRRGGTATSGLAAALVGASAKAYS